MTVRILTGDVREQLATLPDGSVHCVVTSPPYWGLRDYGTAQWEGGESDCDHSYFRGGNGAASAKQVTSGGTQKYQYAGTCKKCGATRIDRQLGMEPTLGEHIETMVAVFREVRRVLRKDGTCWLNYGDCYATAPNGRSAADTKATGNDDRTFRDKPFSTVGPILNPDRANVRQTKHPNGTEPRARIESGGTLKPKDLCMIPNRLAIALQDDGWWIRSEIIWAKPNPMPESVTDRPATAHEKIWLLTRSARYWYDAEAVRTQMAESSVQRLSQDIENQKGSARANGGRKTNGNMKAVGWRDTGAGWTNEDQYQNKTQVGTANLRNVWTVPTKGFSEAHFATFPPDLIIPCIKAGTSEKGCCAECGAPWVRDIKKSGGTIGKSWHDHSNDSQSGNSRIDHGSLSTAGDDPYLIQTVGWSPSCKCNADVVPCTVMDPFGGSGTTGMVADRLGRDSILIELNPEYAEMARRRIEGDAGMFASVAAE